MIAVGHFGPSEVDARTLETHLSLRPAFVGVPNNPDQEIFLGFRGGFIPQSIVEEDFFEVDGRRYLKRPGLACLKLVGRICNVRNDWKGAKVLIDCAADHDVRRSTFSGISHGDPGTQDARIRSGRQVGAVHNEFGSVRREEFVAKYAHALQKSSGGISSSESAKDRSVGGAFRITQTGAYEPQLLNEKHRLDEGYQRQNPSKTDHPRVGPLFVFSAAVIGLGGWLIGVRDRGLALGGCGLIGLGLFAWWWGMS
ncbi:hypothetical protein [Hyphomicrobium sp. CS1GBMeth3]|uniref:hypothetical protein n=1 Tax=Hyphomicrobium sp. CS1GBMeth3 TaxID=1892845 RepID=UPI0011147059|nr:hypothetical protein [Hyphomicrobium sp. CS1GBMeth3]